MESTGRCFVCCCGSIRTAAAGFRQWRAGRAQATGSLAARTPPAEVSRVGGGLACLAAMGDDPKICCFGGVGDWMEGLQLVLG